MPERQQLGLNVIVPNNLSVRARDWPHTTYLELTAQFDILPWARHQLSAADGAY
jgi:hypothetical protein